MTSAVGPRAQLLTPDRDARPTDPQSLPGTTPERILAHIRLVARMLEDHPGLTSRELAEHVGYGRRHMSLLLLRLEEHRHVVHEGRRWFPGPEAVD